TLLPERVGHGLCANPLDPATLSEDGRFVVFLALLSLNEALLLEERFEAARTCLEKAQSYAITARARLRLSTAEGATFLQQNERPLAAEAFERALLIAQEAGFPPTQLSVSRGSLGLAQSALLADDTEAALGHAARALDAAMTRGEISQIVESLRLIAGALSRKDRKAALRTLELAARLIERVPIGELDGERRATYLASQHAVFTELMELLAE